MPGEMEFLHKLYNLLRHLGEDASWRDMINYIGVGKLYAVLFMIVFCETGLVVTPFLPGDSLLFAIGAVGGARHGDEAADHRAAARGGGADRRQRELLARPQHRQGA